MSTVATHAVLPTYARQDLTIVRGSGCWVENAYSNRFLDLVGGIAVEPEVSGPSCTIELDLGLGDGSASYLTSDLSYDYVRINADYRT